MTFSQRFGASGRVQAAGPEAVGRCNVLAALNERPPVQACAPYSVSCADGPSFHPGEGVPGKKKARGISPRPGLMHERLSGRAAYQPTRVQENIICQMLPM